MDVGSPPTMDMGSATLPVLVVTNLDALDRLEHGDIIMGEMFPPHSQTPELNCWSVGSERSGPLFI